jgi:branched-chain amino acid transport system substrate-binding protein
MFLVLAGLLFVGLCAACGGDDTSEPTAQQQEPPRTVTIGVVQSLTGAGGVYGKTVVEGIQLAVGDLNHSASSTGIRYEYEVVDDKSDVAASKEAFAGLIAKGVDAIVGPTLSNLAPEDHKLAQQAGIPVLGATTTAVGITDVGDYIFRIALPESVVVPATIARVVELHPIRQAVLVLDSNDAFSRSSAAAMRDGLAAKGGTILKEIDVAKSDINGELAGLQGQSFDAFLVTPLLDTSAAALKAIRAAGFQELVIGGNSFNTPDIDSLSGGAAEGAYVGAAWNPGEDNPTSRGFVGAYTEEFGHAPDQFAAQGYSTVYVLADAERRAGSGDHAAVRDALAATKDLATPLGSLSISDKREAQHEPVVQQYQGGKLVVVQ